MGGRHVRSKGVVVLGIAPVCFDASKAQWPRKLAYALGRESTGDGARLEVMINSVEWSLVISRDRRWLVRKERETERLIKDQTPFLEDKAMQEIGEGTCNNGCC